MVRIHPTALINDNVKIGNNVVIMPYAVIGFDGFYKGSDGLSGQGRVEIGDDCIIGIGVCIMSGDKGVTRIGHGTKLMNNVNVGHDTIIGNQCIISAGTIIPGFVEIEDYVNMGVNSTVKNRIKINTGCMIGMGSVITKNTDKWTVYQGNPARAIRFNDVGAARSGLTSCYEEFTND